MTTRRAILGQLAGAGTAAFLGRTTRAVAESRKAEAAPLKGKLKGLVQTVLGPIEASKLGFTLPHEHICAGSQGLFQMWPEFFGGRTNFVNKVVDKLKAAKDEGIDTIVDVTPADGGRDVRLLEEVSRKSGMQIVACTGHWLYPSRSMAARSTEELTEFYVLEIERGLEGTDIKPGVIKVATDQQGVTPFLNSALRAAARASKATGIPIETHTHSAARMGEKQADIFEAEGLSPASVSLGHSDDTDDMEYLMGLVKRGYTLGMEHATRVARDPVQPPNSDVPKVVPWRKRMECVKRLIDAGFADQIFLSNDWFFGISSYGTGTQEALDRINPDGMLFLTRKMIPYLKEIGVSDQMIHTMTVDSPKAFFGGS